MFNGFIQFVWVENVYVFDYLSACYWGNKQFELKNTTKLNKQKNNFTEVSDKWKCLEKK